MVYVLTINELYLYGFIGNVRVCVCVCVVARSSAWEQLFRAALATHTWVWLALGDSIPPSLLPSLLTSLLFSGGRSMLAAPIILMPSLSLPGMCVYAPAHSLYTDNAYTQSNTTTESCQEREHKALMPWSALFLYPPPPLALSLSLCLTLTFSFPSSFTPSLPQIFYLNKFRGDFWGSSHHVLLYTNPLVCCISVLFVIQEEMSFYSKW